MKKLLVICGPTSTGKTSLAINLAKKLNGEIISADSRQVYRGMDIGTGKDLLIGSKIKYPWFSKYGYYEIGGIKVWGYDLADPRHEFSVAQYLRFANRIVEDIYKKGKLPILVGGTGLYIKGITDRIPTAEVPKNNQLRENLSEKTVDELYEMLANLDSIKAGSMNASDKRNPRRLIRAIEVAQYSLDHKALAGNAPIEEKDILFIGLNAPKQYLDKKIKTRVFQRVKDGVKEEIGRLLQKHVPWDAQAMTAMGYGVWRDYFEGDVPESIILDTWAREEVKYVKRQMVWFKKDKRINWFDVTFKEYPKNVEKLAEKWYKGGVY